MSDHVFWVRTRPVMGGLVLLCSCGGYRGPVFPVAGFEEIPLTRLNEIAHEHIVAAEEYRHTSAPG